MCVPVTGPEIMSMGWNAGSVSRPTSTSQADGCCSWDGKIMSRKEEEIHRNSEAAGLVARPTSTSQADGCCSWDGNIMPRMEEEICRNRAVGLSGAHGGRHVVSLLALVLILAINFDTVESESSEVLLVQLPSGFRCTWYSLPHFVQLGVIIMMLGILYGVNRLFDKADEAASTRLSCATAGLLNERRRHHHQAAPRIPRRPPGETKPRLQHQQQQQCASSDGTGKPKCFVHGGTCMVGSS